MGVVAQRMAGVGDAPSPARPSRMTFRPSIAGILAGGAVGVLLLVGVGVDDDIALVYGGGIALCVTIALGTQRGERDVPFARWLLVVTGLWALSALANSGDEVLYSVGRVAAWLIEPLLLYLLLAFPYGRLRTASERRVAIGTALVAGLLYLPTALLGEFPLPSPWAASCGLDCPDNAFALTSWEGADVLRAVREPLTVGLFAWAAWLIVARAREGRRDTSPPRSRRVYRRSQGGVDRRLFRGPRDGAAARASGAVGVGVHHRPARSGHRLRRGSSPPATLRSGGARGDGAERRGACEPR